MRGEGIFPDRFHFTGLHVPECALVFVVDEDAEGLCQPADGIVEVETEHFHSEVDGTSEMVADEAAVFVFAYAEVERWLGVGVERTEAPMLSDREPEGISNLLDGQVTDFLNV